MSPLRMQLRTGPTASSISVSIRNESTEPVSVVAPDPYHAIAVQPTDGGLCFKSRAIAWNNSRKTIVISPGREVLAHIDLDHYYSDLAAEVAVSVQFEVIDAFGVSASRRVEGVAILRIRSIDEKIAEMKAKPRPRNNTMKRFDVSDSTQFECVYAA